MAGQTTAQQWREAANVLREHANKFDVLADEAARSEVICGVVSQSGRYGEPLACAWKKDHTTPHSWASLPTFGSGGCIVEAI